MEAEVLSNWVFILALALMAGGVLGYLNVLRKQYRLFRRQDQVQHLKYLLFAAVILLILGALPLMFVYADIVWFHFNSVTIIYVAVICNAASKLITGIILNLIYNFRLKDEE